MIPSMTGWTTGFVGNCCCFLTMRTALSHGFVHYSFPVVLPHMDSFFVVFELGKTMSSYGLRQTNVKLMIRHRSLPLNAPLVVLAVVEGQRSLIFLILLIVWTKALQGVALLGIGVVHLQLPPVALHPVFLPRRFDACNDR